MAREAVFTDAAPRPVGPYSQAIVVDGWIFIAGQIPLDPKSGELVEGEFRVQVRRALDNLKAIVEAAGGSMDDLVKVTVYLKDITKFDEFNQVYKEYFKSSYPARVVVEVSDLPKGAEVEVEAIGYIGKGDS
ncbi:MAG: RidA family protein [Desulfurococcales archaeon]|nr:RidA family protein [Desulfurococcales archaeon]MEB3779978.1 RidA family protein [Desulfurococcales archaeon]